MPRINRKRLVEQARAGGRTPQRPRLRATSKEGYRPRTVSLYKSDDDWLGYLVRTLAKAGLLPRGNHSFVIQELLRENREALEEKGDDEVVSFFRKRLLKRMPGA